MPMGQFIAGISVTSCFMNILSNQEVSKRPIWALGERFLESRFGILKKAFIGSESPACFQFKVFEEWPASHKIAVQFIGVLYVDDCDHPMLRRNLIHPYDLDAACDSFLGLWLIARF
jgi:hypothetical protein